MSSGLRRKDGWLALCASVLFGMALSVAGCGDVDLNQGSSGGGKGPELERAASQQPSTGSASSMAQSTPTTAGTVPPIPCGEGVACVGTNGCTGSCDADGLITGCTHCDNGTFTDCTQRTCQP